MYGRYAGGGVLAGGVALVGLPSAAFANNGPPVLPPNTSLLKCSDVTPLDTISPVTLTETVNTKVFQGPPTTFTEADGVTLTFPSTFTIGSVRITAPNGRSVWFFEAYRTTEIEIELYQTTGWAVVGPGANGNDVTYLEGGSATINHYGVPFEITGRSLDLCKALGA